MDKSRLFVIIILILIAVLFAVGVGAGLFNSDYGLAPKDPREIKSALKEVPGVIKSLGNLLDSQGPKLVVEDFTDVKSHPITVPAGAVLVTHLRASGDDYRKATFRLIDAGEISSKLEIHYQTDCLPPRVDKETESGRNMKDQKLELAYPVPKLASEDVCTDADKACGKLTIFKCGGTLNLACLGLSPCQVALRQ